MCTGGVYLWTCAMHVWPTLVCSHSTPPPKIALCQRIPTSPSKLSQIRSKTTVKYVETSSTGAHRKSNCAHQIREKRWSIPSSGTHNRLQEQPDIFPLLLMKSKNLSGIKWLEMALGALHCLRRDHIADICSGQRTRPYEDVESTVDDDQIRPFRGLIALGRSLTMEKDP